jgi:hypothetical protein
VGIFQIGLGMVKAVFGDVRLRPLVLGINKTPCAEWIANCRRERTDVSCRIMVLRTVKNLEHSVGHKYVIHEYWAFCLFS